MNYLTESQRRRMNDLREREIDGDLAESERSELAELISTVERAEAAYLRPATARIREQRVRIAEGNAELRNLIRRKERLAQRLKRILTG